MSNKSPSAPHVFGTTAQKIKVTPNQKYTLSLWASSKDLSRTGAVNILVDSTWAKRLIYVMACKLYLDDVDGADCRARIELFFEIYEKTTLPKLPHLRKSVIHNDVNEQNVLVEAHNPDQISGLIDFGELQYGTHINELAVTLAYALLGEDDINMAIRQIIDGYTEVFSLEAEEMEVLPNLMAMRLVQSIIMTSNSTKDFPDNDYIVVSQKPARELLRRIEGGELSI